MFLVYSETEHPRFGLIHGVLNTRDLKAGSELFTHYLYKEEQDTFPVDFPWYYEMLEKLKAEEKQNRSYKKKPKEKS